jgi:glycosyltransferase involved in cell wall biosynthesis
MHKSLPKSPRVSVILTVYNRTNYLAEALESALSQSYKDFEIIVADDSGTAASQGIAASCSQPERVRYRPNPSTLGVVRSLVGAIEAARGELIAILNDDDVWEEDLLAELIIPFDTDKNCVAAFADHLVMDATGHSDLRLSEAWSAAAGRSNLSAGLVHNRNDIVEAGLPIANSTLFRKHAVDWSLVVPRVAGAYDYWISCLLMISSGSIYYIPRLLARYRLHSGMETKRRSHDKADPVIYILTTLLERQWFPEMEDLIRLKLAAALFDAGRDKLHFGFSRDARRLFIRSFRMHRHFLALAGVIGACLPSAVRKTIISLIDFGRRGYEPRVA